MREIVYFWISEYRNIKNQGFNFGSEYEYYTEVTDEKVITRRKENYLFIKNFFQTDNSKSILNISAFVGENGAGKSNFLDAIKHALTNDRDWFGYILIFKDDNGDVFHSDNLDIKTEYEFEESNGTSAIAEVIYYNPALDNKIYPITHDNNSWIDISTDWLIFQDFEEQKGTKPAISQIELFDAQEIERQLKLSNNSEFVDFLNNKITIPSEIRIVSVAGDFPYKIEGVSSNVRNVPYVYRDYYDLLSDMANVVNEYAQKEHQIQVERKIPDELNPFTRKKCFATFLDHLLKNLFYHFDSTNHYLSKGKIGISIEDLQKLPYEEAVYEFIKNIDLIDDTDAIIQFIAFTQDLITKARVDFSGFDEVSWISPKKELNKFLKLKDAYLNQLVKFMNHGYPKSFIGYSWTGISTGEKAMFNLFSRFAYAKEKILERVDSNRRYNSRIPTMLYLLIDEAELGFHLQWQKEYINDIIEFLPKTLIFDTEDGKQYPSLQFLFTTHSTLTLSDIPNSHITYIKNKERNAHVLIGENRPSKSFGANVHSLMSDSFFLRNGLVGSFAIKKINSIVKILNSGNLSSNDIELVNSIINIIDEPILKAKLQSMLEDLNSNISELKKLEKMRENIDERIKKLKGND